MGTHFSKLPMCSLLNYCLSCKPICGVGASIAGHTVCLASCSPLQAPPVGGGRGTGAVGDEKGLVLPVGFLVPQHWQSSPVEMPAAAKQRPFSEAPTCGVPPWCPSCRPLRVSESNLFPGSPSPGVVTASCACHLPDILVFPLPSYFCCLVTNFMLQ